MCSASGGQVHGVSITLAWWQLLALCWMINNWLPVQLLLTGYFKDCYRDPPWTHEEILWSRKSIASPVYKLWPQSQSPGRHTSPGDPSEGYHWKPFMMGLRVSHSRALRHRSGCCPTGASTSALLVRIWGSSYFCLPWIAFHFSCLFLK